MCRPPTPSNFLLRDCAVKCFLEDSVLSNLSEHILCFSFWWPTAIWLFVILLLNTLTIFALSIKCLHITCTLMYKLPPPPCHPQKNKGHPHHLLNSIWLFELTKFSCQTLGWWWYMHQTTTPPPHITQTVEIFFSEFRHFIKFPATLVVLVNILNPPCNWPNSEKKF